MKVEIDPVWPWSELPQFLADCADPVVPLLLWSTALLALALPLLLLLRLTRRQHWQLLFTAGLLFVAQFLWVAWASWPSSVSQSGQTADSGEKTDAVTRAVLHSLHDASLGLLLIVPMGLLGWMLRTYFLAPAVTRRRLLAILALRLGAVVCAIVAIARPFLGFPDLTKTSAVIVFLLDDSESMTIQDEADQSRWDRMLRAFRECEPLFARLREEQGIEVQYFRFARDVGAWDPANPGKPDGQRTDIGWALHWLHDNRDRRPIRGLFLLSDGRNNLVQKVNDEPILALPQARRWSRLCPLHTVLLGSPNTAFGQRDVAVTRVTPASSLVQVKTEMILLARIDAPGFEGRDVKVRVFIDDVEVPDVAIETLQRKGDDLVYEECKNGLVTLKDLRNNEVRVKRLYAPTEPGEYKLTVKVGDRNAKEHQALPGEVNKTNNEASTLISVIKGGISVLMVDRQRAGEPQLIYDALRSDPRIRLRMVWLGSAGPVNRKTAEDLFRFDKEKYDVILLGDVKAEQLTAVNKEALKQIAGLLNQGGGLAMLGGYSTFGNGDWKGTALEPFLPVDLNQTGQDDDEIRMTPTDAGLKFYGMGLASGLNENKKAWEELPSLDGRAIIRARDPVKFPSDMILAEAVPVNPAKRIQYENEGKRRPLLVTVQMGNKTRVLAFAGDTTYRWTATPEGRAKHSRFWRQMTVWLANMEKDDGNVWAKPDARDVPVGAELGFSVGINGKGGLPLPNGVFEVDVQTPSKRLKRVNTARVGSEDRGLFKPEEPGEYVIKVKGTARDAEGKEVTGTAEARFLAHEEDVEMAEWAADKVFMDKLAKEGRGKAVTVSEMSGLLKDLLTPSTLDNNKPKQIRWPNWTSKEPSGFLPLFMLIFVGLLTAEWFLRRRWGLV
jgi:hypothetical protein